MSNKFKIGDKVNYIGGKRTTAEIFSKTDRTIIRYSDTEMLGDYVRIGNHYFCEDWLELDTSQQERQQMILTCIHKWKVTQGFMANTMYYDCSLCGVKLEDAPSEK